MIILDHLHLHLIELIFSVSLLRAVVAGMRVRSMSVVPNLDSQPYFELIFDVSASVFAFSDIN